jgi:uncharacterized protein
MSNKALDPKFYNITREIMKNEDVKKLGYINHHGQSILHHSLKVSLVSWKWGSRLNMDTVSLARGALLHDFFLYDWNKVCIYPDRKFYEIHKRHGFTHPLTALNNAEKRFKLNRKERDIIRRHMFPLTLIPPRYPESWLVMIIDKLVTIGEIPHYLQYLNNR